MICFSIITVCIITYHHCCVACDSCSFCTLYLCFSYAICFYSLKTWFVIKISGQFLNGCMFVLFQMDKDKRNNETRMVWLVVVMENLFLLQETVNFLLDGVVLTVQCFWCGEKQFVSHGSNNFVISCRTDGKRWFTHQAHHHNNEEEDQCLKNCKTES